MGWSSLLKRVFEQPLAPPSRFSLDVVLFYASVVHVLGALCYYAFYNPNSSGWSYGKLKPSGVHQGCSVPHSMGWMVLELPSLVIPVLVMAWTRFCHGRALNFLILFLFAGHHLNRAILYPLLSRKYARDTPDRNMPLTVVLQGFLDTSLNGILQSLSAVSFNYDRENRGFAYVYAALCQSVGWEGSIDFYQASQASAQDVVAAGRYAVGIALFLWGMWTNIQSDLILMKLRGMREFVEKCEYSVSLPPTQLKSRGRMARAQERGDTICESTSAAIQGSKQVIESAAYREQKCLADGIRRKSSASVAEDAGLERLDGREVSLPGRRNGSFGHGAKSRTKSRTPVYHSFTRSPASAYKIPRGKWFDYVSSPNYFGEICEWVGFAVASDTYAAFSSACFTTAFLTRRALSVQRWYIDTFGKRYPVDRKAIFPGVL